MIGMLAEYVKQVSITFGVHGKEVTSCMSEDDAQIANFNMRSIPRQEAHTSVTMCSTFLSHCDKESRLLN